MILDLWVRPIPRFLLRQAPSILSGCLYLIWHVETVDPRKNPHLYSLGFIFLQGWSRLTLQLPIFYAVFERMKVYPIVLLVNP